jgi:hypothetical protein
MAKGDASGLSNQGPAPLAQSGGRDTTFGTARGGTKLTRNVTRGGVEGQNQNGVGLQYNVRSATGDQTSAPWKGTVGATPPQYTGGLQKPIQSLRNQRPPAKAGSEDA